MNFISITGTRTIFTGRYTYWAYIEIQTPNSSDLALWEFVPVGNFRLVNVQYEKVVDAGDFVNRRDISLQGAVFPSLPNM